MDKTAGLLFEILCIIQIIYPESSIYSHLTQNDAAFLHPVQRKAWPNCRSSKSAEPCCLRPLQNSLQGLAGAGFTPARPLGLFEVVTFKVFINFGRM
ncbi:hypothetical protein [Neisseria animalis]|uniref:hypothetical protein n=1 Tax=Neisseria animalis TaxID=492 RepID=UPI000F508B6E|nr:hypothetical protein [Neisseria animalis]